MAFFEYSSAFAKICFSVGLLTNVFLLYMTLFHIKKITGTYKIMVVMFSMLGIFFASTEICFKPFIHNYNNAMIFFSFNNSPNKNFIQFGLALYSATYQYIIANIAIQFTFRYATLFKSPLAAKFRGIGILVWILYPVLPGLIYFSGLYMLCHPDQFTDEYVSEEILENYELIVKDIPHFEIAFLDGTGSIRWKNMSFLILGLSLIAVHYAVIIYFGVQMRRNIKNQLTNCSATYRGLQHQFFRALIVQTLSPTFLYVLPAGPVLLAPLLSPLLNFQLSVQSGWVCTIFTLYSPVDSIAFMIIVSEYRNIIKRQLFKLFFGPPPPTQKLTLQDRNRDVQTA